MFDGLLYAALYGFILAFAIGPVFFTLIETSITKGIKAAVFFDLGSLFSDVVFIIIAFYSTSQILEKVKETLRTWFSRKGEPGKKGGWVDCNTCREVDGKTKCKACGREKGEKRSKYPSCRPTVAQCKTPGKGTKWGKTK